MIEEIMKSLGIKKESDNRYSGVLASGTCPVHDYNTGLLEMEIYTSKDSTIHIIIRSIDDSSCYAISPVYKTDEKLAEAFESLCLDLCHFTKIDWKSFLDIFNKHHIYIMP